MKECREVFTFFAEHSLMQDSHKRKYDLDNFIKFTSNEIKEIIKLKSELQKLNEDD